MKFKRMRALYLITLPILAIWSLSVHAKSIRTVLANQHEVISVKTAVGYSTILEFSNKPISAVLGDQDSFKLEYVANSITIKPLISSLNAPINFG